MSSGTTSALERDSFFQIDSEGLSIRFDRADIVRSVGMHQS